MFRKLLYSKSYKRVDNHMLLYYKVFKEQHSWSLEKLEEINNIALQQLIIHSFKNVPYYRDLSRNLKLKPEDIKTGADLIKLPVLDKNIIRKGPESFLWEGVDKKSLKRGKTGGSTGDPLNFFMSRECYYKGVALNLRTFGQAGYSPGDLLIIMGGGSLVGPSSLKSRITAKLLNHKTFSSYGFSNEKFEGLIKLIGKQRRIYIKGYASSLYLLSKFMLDHDVTMKQEGGLFPTSEKLSDSYRFTIQQAFPNCIIYDNYGLNDGGVSATECDFHCGFHVNYGRSLLEVVDDNGNQIMGKSGRILATSLYNYAQPFIRYDTGDYGEITHEPCKCGLNTPRIINLRGRETDYLEIEGNIVASPVLTVLLGTLPQISMYKIIQKDSHMVEFWLCLSDKTQVNNEDLKGHIRETIKKSFCEKVPAAKLVFIFVDSELQLYKGSNKLKFIINENLHR